MQIHTEKGGESPFYVCSAVLNGSDFAITVTEPRKRGKNGEEINRKNQKGREEEGG